MPVIVYRQPWFWAIVIAVVAILGFVVVIAASNTDRTATDSTTIVQQPSPSATPPVVPFPGNTAEPAEPSPPAEPAEPALPPKVIREREVIVKPVPVPVPAQPSNPPALDTSEFQNTGLPKQMKFDDHAWKATTIAKMDARTLKSLGTTDTGVEIWVDLSAREPYTTIYVAVPDEDGAYVRYTLR